MDLENTVLKLRNDLERLRGRFSAWMTTVTLALVIILGLSGWHLVTAEKERRAAEAARLEDRREFLEFKNLFVRDYERGLIPPRPPAPPHLPPPTARLPVSATSNNSPWRAGTPFGRKNSACQRDPSPAASPVI
ncbi:hypothetical protein [Verrucomicrobium spinosum]|uniref:hypothetical protein n=1 Tax=Verrucomicrobium spinosum TaxID=2736 RepID=UPI000946389F|nr:hypothetical protein [Verrucomicrobium spinosum]